MKTFHAAVNHIPEGRNVLVRIKELGNSSPTLKLPKELFGEVAPQKHESFLLEVEGLAQMGNYLIATGNCKIAQRELEAAKPFDVDAYMASLNDGPF